MKRLILTALALPICFAILSAQTYNLSGKITDAVTGDPLIGATIRSSGQNSQGTISDVDGSFSIDLQQEDTGIIVDYLGYEDYILAINYEGGDQVLDIALTLSKVILETTTITGSRYEKSLAKSAVSINVIKPKLLESTNTTKVDKLLDKIPGVQIIDGQANIRGGSGYSYGAGSRVLLLIDDVPAFQADAGRPLWDDIPVENISQIEVLKGASSALYGSAALNGIINIRTGYATSVPSTKVSSSFTSYLSPADSRKQWWGSAEETSPHRYHLGAVHKQKFGTLDVVAAGFYENTKSYYRAVFKEKYRLSANLKYRFSDRINLAINTMYNYKNDGNYLLWADARSGAYTGWEGTYTAGTTKRYYIDPQLTIYDKKNNKHKLITRFYELNNTSVTNQATSSENFFLEYQFTSKLRNLGIEYTLGSSGYFASSQSELYGNLDLGSNNMAAYGQLEKTFKEKLTVTLGTRYEYNQHPEVSAGDTLPYPEDAEGRLVSRIGLNYQLAEFTNLRGSWGQGYRFPTLAEKFVSTDLGSFLVIPNPELESETGWTAELGIKQGIKLGGWQGFVDVAVFRSEYNNMMEFTFGQFAGQSGFQSQNVGNTLINGAELNLIGRSKIDQLQLDLLLGYTFLDSSYKDFDTNDNLRASISVPTDPTADRNTLKYRNKHNFKFDAELTRSNISLGISANYTSPMITIDQFLSLLNEINQYREANGGYFRTDVRMGYDFGVVKVSVLAENLLNEEYAIRPGILEAPRNLSVRAELDF